uniref:Rv3654c family TadE-like protein n=1 Tax=Brevibacterium sp. TaxID=1701 RepID=UPI0025BA570D
HRSHHPRSDHRERGRPQADHRARSLVPAQFGSLSTPVHLSVLSPCRSALTPGGGLRAKSQADAAADLAALAAVQALTAGEGEPCEVAEEVAERNGGSVTECIVRADLQRSALEVEVPIELRIPGLERKPVMKGEAVAGIAGP